jgi:hypothetical protein
MLKQIKKTLAVLLAVCFMVTVTAGAVSAQANDNVHQNDNVHHKLVTPVTKVVKKPVTNPVVKVTKVTKKPVTKPVVKVTKKLVTNPIVKINKK